MYHRIIKIAAMLAYACLLMLPLVPATTAPAVAADCPAGVVCIYNPLGTDDESYDIRKIIGRVIRGILSFVGSIALLMFIYGGVLWMTSNGNPERIKKGKDILVWAIAGLGIIFSSYAIVNAILNALTRGTTSNSG